MVEMLCSVFSILCDSFLTVVLLSQVAIKEETVAQEELQGELTCEVCELTFEGILEMEQHSATHFVDNKNVSVDLLCSLVMSHVLDGNTQLFSMLAIRDHVFHNMIMNLK